MIIAGIQDNWGFAFLDMGQTPVMRCVGRSTIAFSFSPLRNLHEVPDLEEEEEE